MIFRSIIPALEQTRLKLRKWWGKMLARNRTAATVDTKEMTSDMPAACLQTIIDGFEDDVLVISPDFRIKQVNSAVQRRLATPLSSVVGQPCFQVRHGAEEPCQPPWYECPLQRVLETGQSVRVVHTHQDESLEDGQPERWVEVIASPIWDEKGNITEVIELVRDITENKKLQKDIVRANRELLALNSIAHALSQSLDLKVVLKAVAETMLDALEAQVSWVRLSEEAGKATARASRGLPAEAADEVIQTVSNMSS
ncbi:MAG: PAS domain-containing protein, partial [Chloroflexi bacterium]|nr:PAS domain-containing protein [Chloroflexota bacterium]